MALNAWPWTTTLNTKLWRNGGFERQTKDTVALKSKLLGNGVCLTMNNGFECQTVNNDSKYQTAEMMALKAWLWTPNCKEIMTTLNVKLWTMALNTKLWRNDDSIRLNVDDGSEHLNCEWLWTSELWINHDGSECQTEDAALNVKLETDDGSERRNWECDSERRTEKWWWLWTPKLRMRWGWL